MADSNPRPHGLMSCCEECGGNLRLAWVAASAAMTDDGECLGNQDLISSASAYSCLRLHTPVSHFSSWPRRRPPKQSDASTQRSIHPRTTPVTIPRATVIAALDGLRSPDGALLDTSTAGPLAITTTADRITVSIAINDPALAVRWEPIRREIETRLATIPGATKPPLVSLTADRAPASTPPAAPAPVATFPNLSKIKRIIAVASGKGGVGKSTTACNLALTLRAQGLKVGILDADIYGPSMPKLLNLKGRPNLISGRTLAPLEAYGCKVMSIGFVVETETALVWRGPMVASAITQMLRDIAWGTLDVLIVDMPPGTGDAQLTLAQSVPLAGAVIVSTPQDLALIDARRGVEMFRAVNVPILGLIENMSYFICDDCGKRHHIFSHGGARTEAAKLGVPFLGEIPLDPLIRERADSGLPIVVTDPDGPQAAAYADIAAAMLQALAIQ
jgi:ATP-binding protein involved in chromosome partitioning